MIFHAENSFDRDNPKFNKNRFLNSNLKMCKIKAWHIHSHNQTYLVYPCIHHAFFQNICDTKPYNSVLNLVYWRLVLAFFLDCTICISTASNGSLSMFLLIENIFGFSKSSVQSGHAYTKTLCSLGAFGFDNRG